MQSTKVILRYKITLSSGLVLDLNEDEARDLWLELGKHLVHPKKDILPPVAPLTLDDFLKGIPEVGSPPWRLPPVLKPDPWLPKDQIYCQAAYTDGQGGTAS